MAYQRIHIDGTLGSGAEEFSTSFAVQSLGGDPVTDPAVLAAWADACLALWAPGTGWPGDLRAMLGSTSAITTIRVYNYPAPGSAADALGQSSTAAVAGSGTVILPFQSSLVYTLRTARPGRSYRGRMYWPFVTASMLATGLVNTASTSLASRASSFAQMLAAHCTAGPLASLDPMVASAATGDVTPVTSVRVGNVMDTQRRRRDNLVESFGSAAIP